MESFAPDLSIEPRVLLTEDHVERLRDVSTCLTLADGDRLADVGTVMDTFHYVVSGKLTLIDPFTQKTYTDDFLGPGQFLGDVSLFYGGAWTVAIAAQGETQVIACPREMLLSIMSEIPEMSDIIINVFNGRRRRQMERGDSGLTVIGADVDAALKPVIEFAMRSHLPIRDLELGSEEAVAAASQVGAPTDKALVLFGRLGEVDNPTPRRIAELLGIDLCVGDGLIVDVLIVGGGPAGVSAAVYAGAEGLSCLVVDELAIGGQAGTSSRIENYMGFPTGISGADLVWRGQVQAMKFGAQFAMPRRVCSLTRQENGLFRATLGDKKVCAKSVIIAAGVQYRKLPLDRLQDFEGRGIYYAATETEARYCANREAVVIGGGNSAGQAAMYLSRHASVTHLVVRRDNLHETMSNYLLSRVQSDPRIKIHYEAEVTALHGGDDLTGLTLTHNHNGTPETIDTGALFIMIGAAPNTDWLSGLVDVDEKGFVKTGADAGQDFPFSTSEPGLYAVGDIRSKSTKRVASAVGEGSIVISHAWTYVQSQPDNIS